MRVSAHLCFDGQCEAAFRFYQEVFGGRIGTMLSYGESALAQQTPAHLHDRIIHASLVLDEHELLGADLMPADYRAPAGFFVMMALPDVGRAQRIFAALGQGGEIRMPFQETFWSPGFGVVVDRFGTPWEIGCEQAEVSG